MFDNGYSVTCRDAALPWALFKLRGAQGGRSVSAIRAGDRRLPGAADAQVPDLGRVEVIDCKLKDADVAYRAYQLVSGDLLYSAEGLTGLRQRAPARPQEPRHRPARQRRGLDRDDRRRRSFRLRPGAGRDLDPSRALAEPIAATMPEAMPRPRSSSPRSPGSAKAADQSQALAERTLQNSATSAATRSAILLRAPRSSSALGPLVPAACADHRPSTSSTGRSHARSRSSASRCQGCRRRRWRRAGQP